MNGQGPRRSTGPMRVMVVEASDVLAAGLEQVLRTAGMDLVGVARDGSEAMRMMGAARPTVVLIDPDLPEGGIRTGHEIIHRFPGTKVAVLVSAEDGEAAIQTRRAGFHGHISVRAAGPEMARSVERIVDGPDAVLAIASARPEDDSDDEWIPSSQLTDREREVLRLLAVGHRNDRIAEILFLSPHTVRTHVQNIRTKLGVRSRLEAALFAIQSGLAEPRLKAQSA